MLSFHQPSPAMYELLDRVFLMARGHMVYSGEPAAAYGHFERAGLPCPGHTAIAEHMLTSVSDPAMLHTLMAHVDSHGPHAGIAAVRTPRPVDTSGPWDPNQPGVILHNMRYRDAMTSTPQVNLIIKPSIGASSGI